MLFDRFHDGNTDLLAEVATKSLPVGFIQALPYALFFLNCLPSPIRATYRPVSSWAILPHDLLGQMRKTKSPLDISSTLS